MKIIKPSFEILTPIDEVSIYKQIESVARTCYKSEDCIGEDGKLTYSYDLSHEGFVFERRVHYC